MHPVICSTLNVNEIKYELKDGDCQIGSKNKTQSYVVYKKTYKYKGTYKLKVNVWAKNTPCQHKSKEISLSRPKAREK